jgi:hypothetical protein
MFLLENGLTCYFGLLNLVIQWFLIDMQGVDIVLNNPKNYVVASKLRNYLFFDFFKSFCAVKNLHAMRKTTQQSI